MMPDISYREFSEAGHSEILELFQAAFGKPSEYSHWRWEYLEGPRKPIVVLVEVEGKLAGHYAALPRRIKAGDRILETGLVVDVMTHPSFGRRGIFSKAGLEAFRVGHAAGIEMFTGFPNDAAIRGHLKVGWTELGSVRVCIRPLSLSGILKSVPPVSSLASGVLGRLLDVAMTAMNKIVIGGQRPVDFLWSTASQSAGLLDEVAQLHSEYAKELRVCGIMDADWLKWRLLEPQNPAHILTVRDRSSGRIRGALLLKIKMRDGVKTGAILEVISFRDGPSSSELQREAIRKCIDEGCELMIRFRSPHRGLRGPPIQLFFIPTPRKVRFIIRSTSHHPLPDLVNELDNWHLELIDHDSF